MGRASHLPPMFVVLVVPVMVLVSQTAALKCVWVGGYIYIYV